ncbi:MAG TPA: hypothetical protein ENN69_07040, partial [Spirochaetia bacterium]|nr:hypothetical protein [Spirochaetia bacterium]
MIRIELFYKPQFTDGRALRLRASLEKHFHISIKNLSIVDVFLVEERAALTDRQIDELFVDHVAQEKSVGRPVAGTPGFSGWDFLLEIAYKPGVTDPVAITAEEAIAGISGGGEKRPRVRTARQYLFSCPGLTADKL